MRGNVSAAGRPRPAGRPVARAAATIQITPAIAPATPMNPKKSPPSKVDSMPTILAPQPSAGGRPPGGEGGTGAGGRGRRGKGEGRRARPAGGGGGGRPATSRGGVPTATVISATPPIPGITSPRNPRRVAAACARAAAPSVTTTPQEARTALNAMCGYLPAPISYARTRR